MESKTWKTKTEFKEQFIKNKEHFGWTFTAESIDRNGKTMVSMQREKNIPNYKVLRKLEKQHKRMNKFPISSIYLIIIGFILLIPYFFLNKYLWSLSFILPASIIFFIALFNIGAFLIMKSQAKKMERELFNEADVIRGVKVLAPYPEHLVPPIDGTSFKIKEKIYDKEYEKRSQ